MYGTYRKIHNVISKRSDTDRIKNVSNIKIGKSNIKIGQQLAHKIVNRYDNRHKRVGK